MKAKFVRVMALALVAALMLSVVGMAGAQDVKRVITGISMVGGDIPSIDPSLSETSASIEVLNQLFIGLTNQDVLTGESALGIASGFEVTENEDGTATFTFTLIPDIAWVRYNPETDAVEQVMDDAGNPRYVTAQDVAYGMQRSLTPETASPYSYVLIPYVVGAAEFNAGEADASALGVEVIDDTTIAITAPDITGFTPSIYGLWMARPQPQWAVEAGGDSWTEVEYINTNGPFALKEWAHDESITIVRNPFWQGTETIPAPALDEVTFRFLDPQAQFAEYLAGTMDAIQIPLEEIQRIEADPELSAQRITGNQPCTYYIGFDNLEAPTDNVYLRRALSLAIDRESIVTNVTRGGQIPAQWFSRPGLNAAPTLEDDMDLGITYDPAAAQEEFALALEELGMTADQLQLTLSYNDSSNHGAIMQAVQQMWSDTLGVTAQLSAMDPSTYFASLSEEPPMAYRSGWCQDYGDANNFLYDVFYSEASQNDTGFYSAEFDELVSQARVETDPAVRRDLYRQAEEILVVDQAAIAPIYFYVLNLMVKPEIERAPSVTGNEAYYLWDRS